MKFWLWLDNIKGLGPVNAKRLLNVFNTPVRIYKCTEEELLSVEGIGPKLAKSILLHRNTNRFTKDLKQLNHHNIKILTYNNRRYPDFIKQERNAPIVLYYKGQLKKVTHTLCITGNTSPSDYSKKVIKDLIPELITNDITLVSGLTPGTETIAHQAYLDHQAYQIAIVPHSLDLCYPSKQRQLMDDIIQCGMVLSRHSFNVKPIKPFYILKHDLMAIWSKRILIVELSKLGNGYRTTHKAHDIDRPVYVVPHNLFQDHAEGSHQLLSTFARCYTSTTQLTNKHYFKHPILQLPTEPRTEVVTQQPTPKVKQIIKDTKANTNQQLGLFDSHSPLDLKILSLLKEKPLNMDSIAHKTNTSIPIIIDALTMLELNYHISSIPGNKYKYNDQ